MTIKDSNWIKINQLKEKSIYLGFCPNTEPPDCSKVGLLLNVEEPKPDGWVEANCPNDDGVEGAKLWPKILEPAVETAVLDGWPKKLAAVVVAAGAAGEALNNALPPKNDVDEGCWLDSDGNVKLNVVDDWVLTALGNTLCCVPCPKRFGEEFPVIAAFPPNNDVPKLLEGWLKARGILVPESAVEPDNAEAKLNSVALVEETVPLSVEETASLPKENVLTEDIATAEVSPVPDTLFDVIGVVTLTDEEIAGELTVAVLVETAVNTVSAGATWLPVTIALPLVAKSATVPTGAVAVVSVT